MTEIMWTAVSLIYADASHFKAILMLIFKSIKTQKPSWRETTLNKLKQTNVFLP